ncbi:MAG: c-type cytochrome [Bacteroidota bacterium]
MLRILPLFVLLFLLSFCSMKKQSAETASSADVPANYTKYCASCHGASAEVFVKRDWKYGTSRLDFIRGIKEGYPLAGMQGYAGLLTDEQILDLAKNLIRVMQLFSPSDARVDV